MVEKNQIRRLLIWVHPGWERNSPATLSGWKDFIERTSQEHDTGLVEISGMRDKKSVGSNLKRLRRERPTQIGYFEAVAEIETFAALVLADRYLVWPYGNFIIGSEDDHLRTLRSHFNAEPRNMDNGKRSRQGFIYEYKVLFESVGCFGLYPDGTVKHQVNNTGMHHIANRSENLGLTGTGLVSPAF